VIKDLDESIKQLLIEKGALNLTEVNISFEAPDRDWAASQSKPAINIYLYDIHENHELRSYEWTVERNNNRTATRKKTPLRVAFSYLITVWTKDIGDEHSLLGHIMAVLCRHHCLPEEILQGGLKGLEYPVHASTAQPDGLVKNPADFWSALDNQLKPYIDYVVTLPVDLDITLTAPVVFTKTLEVKEAGKKEVEEMAQIGGIVHEKGKPEAGIVNAVVTAKEKGMTAKTDNEGHYSFAKLEKGKYTFQVSAPGWTAKEIRMVVPSDDYNIELVRR
jgi:hypothetical protein